MSLDLKLLLDLEPQRWLRRVPGRETFLWPQVGDPHFVIKRMRGDDWRERWFERLHGERPRAPARREHDNLLALAAQGLPVPRTLGCLEAQSRQGQFTSLVAMEYIPHQRDLRQCAKEAAPTERALWGERLLELVVRLHELGWYHRDLYLQHFLALDEPGRLVLIDVGRARWQGRPRRRWHIKDLAALAHSLPDSVPTLQLLRFLIGYFRRRQIRSRSERRGWVRAIEARRRRMAAHRPRFGEAGALD